MFTLETSRQPLLPKHLFIRRLGRFASAALLMLTASWLIGILGYRILEGMSWIDAILNSAMILGGMGPVNPLHTNLGKLFASFYALFSGIIFVASASVVVAPLLHRFLHSFHVEPTKADDDDDKSDDKSAKTADTTLA